MFHSSRAELLELYVDHCVQLEGKKFESLRDKLLQGIAHYRALAAAYPGENPVVVVKLI